MVRTQIIQMQNCQNNSLIVINRILNICVMNLLQFHTLGKCAVTQVIWEVNHNDPFHTTFDRCSAYELDESTLIGNNAVCNDTHLKSGEELKYMRRTNFPFFSGSRVVGNMTYLPLFRVTRSKIARANPNVDVWAVSILSCIRYSRLISVYIESRFNQLIANNHLTYSSTH